MLLIGGSKFSANQKLYPDPDNDASLVWNFCTCFSVVILRENLWPASRNVGCFPYMNISFTVVIAFSLHKLILIREHVWKPGGHVVSLRGRRKRGRGRGRGNLGTRGRKERKACKDAIVFSVFHAQILSVKIVGQN